MKQRFWRIGADVSAADRARILAIWPAILPQVFCKQITYAYKVDGNHPLPDGELTCRVAGLYRTPSIQALALEVNGRLYRPDGKLFHLTIAIDNGLSPSIAGAMQEYELEPVPAFEFTCRPFQSFPLWKTKPTSVAA